MPDLNKIYLYRMTHILNIPHILQHGITHLNSENANSDFVPIGDGQLIETRKNFMLNNGRRLGEYIPFYFGVRTPMLYVVQNGFNMVTPTPVQNIVYCVSSIQKIIDQQLDYLFTDGHALDRLSSQYTDADIQNIDNILDMNAIKAKYWKDENDLDKKRKKEAEFLVLGDIAKESILGIITYNKIAKNTVISFGADESKVYVKSEFYF